MSAWENQPVSNTIPKAEAIAKIMAMANDEGLVGAFKVFYQDNIVADPSNLPDQVNMDEVKVSAVLDQA